MEKDPVSGEDLFNGVISEKGRINALSTRRGELLACITQLKQSLRVLYSNDVLNNPIGDTYITATKSLCNMIENADKCLEELGGEVTTILPKDISNN